MSLPEIAKAAQTKVKDTLEFFARKTGFPIDNKEAASMARRQFITQYMKVIFREKKNTIFPLCVEPT